MIRPVTPADAATVIALWHACGLTRPWNDPAADFERAFDSPAATILLAERDGAIAGSVMVGDDGHRGWIYYLAVAPDSRRAGAGRALVTAAQNWLRERGCAKIQLMVRDDNAEAAAFYTALGLERQKVATYGRFIGDDT